MGITQEDRQAAWDRIKAAGSKEAFILSEMKRLGFWDENQPNADKITQLLEQERELSRELRELLKLRAIQENPEQLLKQIHEQRKKESREKQKETKERRESERQERIAHREHQKKTEINFLGEGYSSLLKLQESSVDRLNKNQLPALHTALDLANAMGISVADLRFLSYSRKNSKQTHYKQFKLPKKQGGFRLISAPMPRLKKAQHWILENILNKVELCDQAHGCVRERSIKTNALNHVGRNVVINQDLKDFFPTVTYTRVLGVFRGMGFSGQVATILALLCTEPRVVELELAGEKYYSQRGERFLPQGSPCSPALANIICRRMDKRLTGLAKKYGFTYSRYVDDLTFSGDAEQVKSIAALLKYSGKVVRQENFTMHPDKLRIMRSGRKQEVTGVVVNEKPNIDKRQLKKFRALIYQIEKDGIEGKEWNGSPDLLSSIYGYAHFINQINPEQGARFLPRVQEILKAHNFRVKEEESKGLISRFKRLFGKK